MATIKDVAKHAGVSISTVSNVLNGTKYVSPRLSEKVMDSVRRLQYEANPIARSMKSNHSGIIGIITEDMCGVFYPYIIKGIASVASERGYQLIVTDAGGNIGGEEGLNKEEEIIKSLIKSRVDGIIFTTMVPPHLRREYCEKILRCTNGTKKIPLISLERNLSDCGIDSVYFDNIENAKKAVTHLIECGCQKIAHIMGPPHMEIASERVEGYRQAVLSHFKDYSFTDLIVHGDYSHQSGYKAMKQILDNAPDVDGVFCANDQMAVGALKLLKEYKRSVPDEIKIIGYDDVFVSSVVEPALSTVHIRKFHTGVQAANLLLKQIEENLAPGNPGRTASAVKMESRLVVRKSTVANAPEDWILSDW